MGERALTERPPFDPESYARESEVRVETLVPPSARGTQPPPPEHANLRESCKDLRQSVPADASARVSGVSLLTSTPALGAVAVPLVGREDFDWFELDERGRSVVALIDDQLIVEEILAATHTPIADGIALFAQLAGLGLVAFRPV